MCPPPTAVIFDLDGTLVQTRESSWKIFSPINSRHNLGIDTAEKFFELFAHNFFASLRAACGTPEKADIVTAEFMQALNTHYSPAMVPGLNDVVKAMVPYSKLAVLSSNTTSVVRRILRENNLEYCFAHVFGGDVEPDKTVGIARFLADAASGSGRLCRAYYDEPVDPSGDPSHKAADPREVVLITDTVGDVEAAVKSGIRAVGVAWGMHTEEQLVAAGAEFVAIWPQELLAHLYANATPSCAGSCSVADSAPEPSSIGSQLDLAGRRRDRRRQALGSLSAGAAPVPAGAVPAAAAAAPGGTAPASRGAPHITVSREDRFLTAALTKTIR